MMCITAAFFILQNTQWIHIYFIFSPKLGHSKETSSGQLHHVVNFHEILSFGDSF